jgi:LSD1 subclass zinc finger protein
MDVEPRELRCNACGAALHYEPGAAVITCGHCGTEYAVEAPSEGVVEFALEEAAGEARAGEAAPPPFDEEVISWLRAGKTVEAVKVVREHTSWGLPECKEYVEALAAREGIALRNPAGAAALAVGAVIALALFGLIAFLILAR